MASENPLWGEERIANELLLKLGLRVSPRTVRKYMPKRPPGRPRGDQRWATFQRNHAYAIVVAVLLRGGHGDIPASLRVRGHRARQPPTRARRRDGAPSAEWTLQQLREVIGFDQARRYLIHDRDRIFASSLDESIRNLGMTVLKSPPHSRRPMRSANG